ncbi:MAG: lysylphosphatidylglycerol synthase domain-containing protein, partial [Bradymonadaceae bacterium]
DELSGHRLELLWTSAGHSFANQLLPARTGELVFPELWRRATGETYAEGTVVLAAIRIVELGVVASLYGIAMIVWLLGQAETGASVWLVGGLIGAGVAVIVALPWLLRIGLGLADRLFRQTRLADISWLAPLREAIPRAGQAVDRLGRRERIWLVVTSIAMWMAMFGVFWFTVAACGAGLGLAQTIVGAGGGIVGNLLPLGTVGSLGTMEAGWTAAFRATGAPVGPVVASGLLVHVIVIAGSGVAAGLAAVGDRLLS